MDLRTIPPEHVRYVEVRIRKYFCSNGGVVSGKIEFGCDFLSLCAFVASHNRPGIDMALTSSAAARFFLLLSDF